MRGLRQPLERRDFEHVVHPNEGWGGVGVKGTGRAVDFRDVCARVGGWGAELVGKSASVRTLTRA